MNKTIVLSKTYEIPVLSNQYEITSTGENEDGNIPFVLYIIIDRTVHIVYGHHLSPEANTRIFAELNQGADNFSREHRRKLIESERELSGIHLHR